jgi:hypothetical protein
VCVGSAGQSTSLLSSNRLTARVSCVAEKEPKSDAEREKYRKGAVPLFGCGTVPLNRLYLGGRVARDRIAYLRLSITDLSQRFFVHIDLISSIIIKFSSGLILV